MDISPISRRGLLYAAIFSFGVVAIIFFSQFFDSRTKIVFCDVGQGDAAYIRIKNRVDVLIDTGPDRKILNCLGRHMPFYDRKIELVINSHPQKDHIAGLNFVIDRYRIGKILMTPLDNQSQSFARLKQKIFVKNIAVGFPAAGTTINILNDRLTVYWPTSQYVSQNIKYGERLLRPPSTPLGTPRNDTDGVSQILGTSTVDDNNFSLVFAFTENDFSALFTGDASTMVLDNIVGALRAMPVHKINILKIPHHGSKTGLNPSFLKLADPEVTVISVGAKNSYGHPAPEVLNALKAIGTKIRRTDREGDIVYKIPADHTADVDYGY